MTKPTDDAATFLKVAAGLVVIFGGVFIYGMFLPMAPAQEETRPVPKFDIGRVAAFCERNKPLTVVPKELQVGMAMDADATYRCVDFFPHVTSTPATAPPPGPARNEELPDTTQSTGERRVA